MAAGFRSVPITRAAPALKQHKEMSPEPVPISRTFAPFTLGSLRIRRRKLIVSAGSQKTDSKMAISDGNSFTRPQLTIAGEVLAPVEPKVSVATLVGV